MVRLNFTASKMDLILENHQISDDDVEIVEVIEPVPEIPVPEIPVPEIPVPEIQVPEISVPEPIVIKDDDNRNNRTGT